MKYRPDIDGLRAIAVLSVLFYHAHLGFPGGYVGVDVFFVISGFLITGVLLKTILQGTFSYIDFWERRVRRLVPALAVVTLFTAITSVFILLPEDLDDLGGALIAQPLLMSNVYFWRVVQGGYFGDPPEIRPLLHTWSLGVEEQFYVLFPLLLMLILSRRVLAAQVGKILAGIALGSLALAILLTPIKSVLSFFTLPTRTWELILGGLLALRLNSPSSPKSSRGWREFQSVLGLGLIAWSVFVYHHETPFPGYAALVPVLGTALLMWANSHGGLTVVGKALSHPVLVRIGQISYSLYLWHWPLIAYGDYLFLLESTEAKWLVVLLSCWLGYLSWRWIETPFREKRWLASRKAIFRLFLAYALVCIALGGIFGLTNGELRSDAADIPKPTRSFVNDANTGDPDLVLPVLGDKSAPPTFLLWGDSHAMSSAAPALDSIGKDIGISGLQLTSSSKTPLMIWDYEPSAMKRPVSAHFKERWASLALETVTSQKLRTVFLVGFWEIYSRENFASTLQQTVQEFNQRGAHVVFVTDNPALTRDPWRQARLSAHWSWIGMPGLIPQNSHREKNAFVDRALAKLPSGANFTVIDLAPAIFGWGSLTSAEGQLLYFDDDHLSDAGSLRLRPLLEPLIRDLHIPRDLHI